MSEYLREGRRVIGATAKPLYVIGGKAGGLDRRVNPVGLRKGTFPPGTGEELLPPPAGGPPPSRREVFGEGCEGGRRNGQVSLRGAKGDRGDRKAPICNRPQGRRT